MTAHGAHGERSADSVAQIAHKLYFVSMCCPLEVGTLHDNARLCGGMSGNEWSRQFARLQQWSGAELRWQKTERSGKGRSGVLFYKGEIMSKIERIKIREKLKKLIQNKQILQIKIAEGIDIENELLDDILTAENFINSVQDTYMRTLLTLRYIKGYSFSKIAIVVGGYGSDDCYRKQIDRYIFFGSF